MLLGLFERENFSGFDADIAHHLPAHQETSQIVQVIWHEHAKTEACGLYFRHKEGGLDLPLKYQRSSRFVSTTLGFRLLQLSVAGG